MTPRAVGAKRCGAQREPGRDTEQTGPWDRCGAAAGAGGSRRQGTRPRAVPVPGTLGKKQKTRQKTNNHRPPAKAPRSPYKCPRASAKQNRRGDFGKRSSCLPGRYRTTARYLPEGRGRPGTPPATSGRLCAGSTGCGRALPARVQPVPGLWHPGGSAEHLPAARPPPPARQDILFVFFCGAHSQRVMSEVRNAGPPCVMRSDSHF